MVPSRAGRAYRNQRVVLVPGLGGTSSKECLQMLCLQPPPKGTIETATSGTSLSPSSSPISLLDTNWERQQGGWRHRCSSVSIHRLIQLPHVSATWVLFCVYTQANSAISCLCDMDALLCLLHRQALFSAILCLCNIDALLCLLHMHSSQLPHVTATWVLFCVSCVFYIFASLFSLSVLFFLSTSFYLLLL
jgi:hypothetical protein